jgi:hypothetical protein
MSSSAAARCTLPLVLAALVSPASPAQAAQAWYCEPLHGYYPAVSSCPAPWRLENQAAAKQAAPPGQATTAAAEPVSAAPKPPADAGGEPTFDAPSSLARGDALDTWCKGKISALNLAVCSDDQLRTLALERLRAFGEANSRLAPDARKTLAADQNGWAKSYPQSCGLAANSPPAVPLDARLKDCLMQAGKTRLTYLRSYGLAQSGGSIPAPGKEASGAAPAAEPAAAPAARADTPAPIEPASTKSTPPPIRIPAAQPAQPAQATQPAAKPVSANPSPGPAAPSSGESLLSLTKVGSAAIALMVVGVWVLTLLRRTPRPRNRQHPGNAGSQDSA